MTAPSTDPGAVFAHALRPGFVLSWGAGACAHHATEAALRFTFTLSGAGRHDADRMRLARARETTACDCAASDGAFHATLALSAEVAEALLADASAPGAAPLRAFLATTDAAELTLPLTPAARLAVESIRRCPFAGTFRTLALTARGNDLLIEFLTALAASDAPRPAALLRSMGDQIRSAGELLAQRLETPPALPELARAVGLSETTLKRGFHQVYGTTVFGHLRTLRMERARALLQSGEATVLEAAALVGYSNPSNFAAAFRRQFGLNPKEFQLTARR